MKLMRRMGMEEFGLYLNGTYVKSNWKNNNPKKQDDGMTYFFPVEKLMEQVHHNDIREAAYYTYCIVWGTKIYDSLFCPIGSDELGYYTLPCFGDIQRTILMPKVIVVFDVDDSIPHINTEDIYGKYKLDEVLLDGYDNKIAKIDKIYMPKCLTWETVWEDTRLDDIIDVTDKDTYNNELWKYEIYSNDVELTECNVALGNIMFNHYIKANKIGYNEESKIKEQIRKLIVKYTEKNVHNTYKMYER